MKDIEPPFPIQEQGNFIDIKKHVDQKQDQEQEDAEPPCPPVENETALLDSQIVLENGKRRKRRKRKKRKQQKNDQTPPIFTKSEWKDYFWTSIIIFDYFWTSIIIFGVSAFLVSGSAAISMQKQSVKEVPEMRAQNSEDPTYTFYDKDMCAATLKVNDPPIVLHLNNKVETLNGDTRCPNKEEHLGIETCFITPSSLKVVFKKGEKGEEGSLFIEHGRGRDQPTLVDMKNEACYSSVEDQTTTTTPKPKESENDKDKKESPPSVKDRSETEEKKLSTKWTDTGGIKSVVGIGVILLICGLVVPLIYVTKEKRKRGIQFSSLLRRAAANPENRDVGHQV